MYAIRPRRLAAGLTQQELADKLGLTDTAISKMEARGRYPSVRMLPFLAAELHCTIDELFTDSPDLPQHRITPKEVSDHGA